MNRFPTNYEAYLAYQRAYAAQECGFWDIACKAAQAGKFIQDSVLGEANAVQQGAGGIANDIQQRVAKGVATTNAQGEAIGKFGYNIQFGAGDALKKGTDALNQLKDSILGQSNAIQQTLGGGIGGIPIPLIIGGGIAVIILIMVLMKS